MEREVKLKLLKAIGFTESKCLETLKNEAVSQKLAELIQQALDILKTDALDNKQMGTLLYHLATKAKAQIKNHLKYLVVNICNGNLKSEVQLDAAFEYLLPKANEANLNEDEFNAHCGVNVHVTADQITKAVGSVFDKHKDKLIEQRYKYNTGLLIGNVRDVLKWADGKAIKSEIDVQLANLLGPKTDEDLNPKRETTAKKMPTTTNPTNEPNASTKEFKIQSFMDLSGEALNFHKPGENYKTEGYVITDKTMDLMKKHLAETSGKVFTRFPPEPNGILHIGHAKAINFNFGYAKKHNGHCYLRFDDTNPEKEEEKFFTSIKDIVNWLGYEPYRITHASDYFDRLYELAIELIKRDKAYACHQKNEEIKGHNPPASPWRNRPIDESLRVFNDMRRGLYDEGEATIRMKLTMEDSKQDPVAYRVKYAHHAKAGHKWCIYPTYDFTHCLNDSIENISHSLCTKEFQSRRSAYYWLCNSLDLYCPVQWEYGRLNISYTVLSKRKILKLVEEGIVRDWDDPRLFTLTALRRRGFPPEAINMFCAKIGVTMAQTVLSPTLLESCVRDVLNVTAPRVMAVLDPLKVTIRNYPFDKPVVLDVLNFPNDENKGSHSVAFDKTIYIDACDFKEAADKSYKRFAADQPVGLRYAGYTISLEKAIRDANGRLCELIVNCVKTTEADKPKGYIQWVSSHGIQCEVRLYDRLFNCEYPDQAPNGFLSVLNKNSIKIVKHAMVDESTKNLKVFDKVQFERIGYFSVDTDSTSQHLVFNRTVSLKEDAEKA